MKYCISFYNLLKSLLVLKMVEFCSQISKYRPKNIQGASLLHPDIPATVLVKDVNVLVLDVKVWIPGC